MEWNERKSQQGHSSSPYRLLGCLPPCSCVWAPGLQQDGIKTFEGTGDFKRVNPCFPGITGQQVIYPLFVAQSDCYVVDNKRNDQFNIVEEKYMFRFKKLGVDIK